jgi:hypothetical protein
VEASDASRGVEKEYRLTKGSMEDHPKESTVYVLECESQLGSVCASASTTVLVK